MWWFCDDDVVVVWDLCHEAERARRSRADIVPFFNAERRRVCRSDQGLVYEFQSVKGRRGGAFGIRMTGRLSTEKVDVEIYRFKGGR